MKVDVLVAEIGSTTTVVNAFKDLDTENPVFWAQGQAPTSVMDGDVRIGLNGAIEDLKKKMNIDSLEYDQMLATSSAAGGLKMTVHGLVYDMTAKAAKEAALGAGGIIHYITVGRLRRTDIAKIREINPNLILIAGGVDYGERDTAIYNGEMIRAMGLKTPVVYAGNIENQEEMKLIFDEESGQYLYLVDNVYPKIDQLNVEPCRKVIQDAFEDHIIHAPGMEHVRDMVNGPIIPTPGAVMECTKLLYDCIGDVMTIDVGGATTDVHAVTEDSDAVARILTAPEPKAKRTVEGDLGVFVNRTKVIESIGEEKLRKECEENLHIDLDKTLESYVAIPKTEDEIKLVERLTQEAVLRAVERHAGQIRYVYGPSGRQTLAEGKDLTQIKYIVGTGGALTRLPNRIELMNMIAGDNETGMKLYPPETAKVLVDNDYIMASLGVLSKTHRAGAIRLLGKSLGMEIKENKAENKEGNFVDELRRITDARIAKEEELKSHIREMEEAGFDLTDYKEALKEKIGGASKEEVLAAKKAALGEDKEEFKEEAFPDTCLQHSMTQKEIQKTEETYDSEQHIMRACGEVDGKPNCDNNCKTCFRKHCKYRKA